MILIITHKEDYTADFLIHRLNERKIKYKRLNCENLLDKEFIIDSNFNFYFDKPNAITSVWFRRIKVPDFPGVKLREKIYLIKEFEMLLKNISSILSVRWVSDPFFVYRAENKLLQLKIAKELGFEVPKTLVTNSKSELKKFYFEHDGDIIIKALSQSKIYDNETTAFIFTNKLKKVHIDNIEDYDLTPCIYQTRIEKDIELRVTVVGDDVFVAGIDSQSNEKTKVDWRKGNLSFFKTGLPIAVENRCRQLVRTLNLKFGAIDIIKDKTGQYLFLEINPNGQWAWIEAQTGLPISSSIIKELIT